MILLAAYETNGRTCEEFKWHKVENPPPHTGYAPNAALHAIKRHAQEFINPKLQAVSCL